MRIKDLSADVCASDLTVARPCDPAADQLPNLEFGLAVGDARQGEAIGEGRAVLVAAFDCNPVCPGAVERKNAGIVKGFGATDIFPVGTDQSPAHAPAGQAAPVEEKALARHGVEGIRSEEHTSEPSH